MERHTRRLIAQHARFRQPNCAHTPDAGDGTYSCCPHARARVSHSFKQSLLRVDMRLGIQNRACKRSNERPLLCLESRLQLHAMAFPTRQRTYAPVRAADTQGQS